MNEDKEVSVLAGMPFGAPGFTPGPGFLLTPCPECGRSMWLGPAQMKKRNEGWLSICFLCLTKSGATLENTQVKSLVEDSGCLYF